MPRSFRLLITPILALALLLGCETTLHKAGSGQQVLFVCEHGNVKSLMAASYFNQGAAARGLPFHAVSRGSAPNSTSIPPPIVEGLKSDGFDVSTYRPVELAAADVSGSRKIVSIGVPLSTEVTGGATVEQWNDVPPASVDYAAARASLKQHVDALLEQMAADCDGK